MRGDACLQSPDPHTGLILLALAFCSFCPPLPKKKIGQPRSQALRSCGDEDPGRGWSRVTAKNCHLRGCWESIKLHASTWNIFSLIFAMLDYIAFLCCLEFAVLNSVYQDTVLKPKQVISLESVYLQKDVM